MANADDLEALFAEARSTAQHPSDDLFARVLTDARSLQPRHADLLAAPAAARAEPGRARRTAGGLWAGLAGIFGGGGILAGMGTAVVAGVVLGVTQPAPVSALTTAIFEGTPVTVDLMPSYESLLLEGTADE